MRFVWYGCGVWGGCAGRIELHRKVVRSGGVRRLARLLRVPYFEAAGRPSKAFVWI